MGRDPGRHRPCLHAEQRLTAPIDVQVLPAQCNDELGVGEHVGPPAFLGGFLLELFDETMKLALSARSNVAITVVPSFQVLFTVGGQGIARRCRPTPKGPGRALIWINRP